MIRKDYDLVSTYQHVAPHMVAIKEFCTPFLEQYGLHHFWYSRFYPDGSFIDLGIDPVWFQFMLERNYFEWWKEIRRTPDSWVGGEERFISTPRNLSVDLSEDDKRVITEKHKVFYMLNIINNKGSYLENFGFSAPPDHHESVSIYSRYFGVLKSFGVFFSQKMAPLIKKIEEDSRRNNFLPWVVPERFLINLSSQSNLSMGEEWNHTNLKHFFISTARGDVSISSRERQCLSLLSQGKCAKEIASTLNLSPRTVEVHLLKIKHKTGLISRSSLVQAFSQSGL